jgi:kynurenine formamidase
MQTFSHANVLCLQRPPALGHLATRARGQPGVPRRHGLQPAVVRNNRPRLPGERERDHDVAPPQRVLVRTYEHMPVDRWDAQLAAYAPDTIERLADLGVLLVGIDTASIDPADSKQLPSHQVIRRRGLRVLENLVLDAVPEGDYELIALPLKLTTADASPVRAVLRAL